jgi:hypothetical protein
MTNTTQSLLPLAVESKPIIHNGNGNGYSVPPVKVRLHKDGTASVRVLGIWLHNLELDSRIALLGSIRRTNGNGGS